MLRTLYTNRSPKRGLRHALTMACFRNLPADVADHDPNLANRNGWRLPLLECNLRTRVQAVHAESAAAAARAQLAKEQLRAQPGSVRRGLQRQVLRRAAGSTNRVALLVAAAAVLSGGLPARHATE